MDQRFHLRFMQLWPAREREKKSFASGLWETADPVMCFGDGGCAVCVCVCGRVIVRGGERATGEIWRVLERIVWWGMVYSKISNRKIYKNTPHFTLKFPGCYINNIELDLEKK